MSLLLEQLGLSYPTRYMYVARRWTNALLNPSFQNDVNGAAGFDIERRNFDPDSLAPTIFVNGVAFGFQHPNADFLRGR